MLLYPVLAKACKYLTMPCSSSFSAQPGPHDMQFDNTEQKPERLKPTIMPMSSRPHPTPGLQAHRRKARAPAAMAAPAKFISVRTPAAAKSGGGLLPVAVGCEPTGTTPVPAAAPGPSGPAADCDAVPFCGTGKGAKAEPVGAAR